MLVERWLTFSFKDRESALISRRYGVPGFFILLLYWNWCSYRLEMGVSGNLWIVVKDVKTLMYMMWNERRLWIEWRGNVLHLELIWGRPIDFAFLRWHECSSLVVTVFLGMLFSSIREIEVPYVFDWKGKPSFNKHLKRSFPLGICMWEGPCVLCFQRNGPRDALIRKKSKFPCRGFMHAHRSYHKMKGCLSPL